MSIPRPIDKENNIEAIHESAESSIGNTSRGSQDIPAIPTNAPFSC
jgi:hypothetical protein